MTKLVTCLFFYCSTGWICAQGISSATDSIPSDTSRHSPKKAVILSAVLPGAGQIYNHIAMPKGKKKAYWKVPLIYAGLGTTGYFFLKNNQMQHDLKAEYLRRQNGETPLQFTQYDSDGVLTLFNQKRTQRDLCILGFAGIYLLNIVDAAVEAHFVHFDVSEDLSLSFHPAILPGNAFGVGARLSFHSPR